MEPDKTRENRNEDGTFKKGFTGNPNGRPVGSISVIDKLRQIYRDNPEKFDSFVRRYADNEANDKHQVEMLDGKAPQSTDITSGGQPIFNIISYKDADNNTPQV